MMKLDETQKKTVSGWIAEGLKVSEIQSRLDKELGVRLTYMEVRFLLDDLRLTPKDQPTPQTEKQIGQPGPASSQAPPPGLAAPTPPTSLGGSKVTVSVDAVTKPGTLVSGSVTFTDGQSAAWHLDQTGRLGLAPQQQGYRPLPEDLEDFQVALQNELQKLGF